MPLRSQQDLLNKPCVYKLKDFERSPIVDPAAAKTTTAKIKKMVPKLDENGNIIYKTVIIPVKKGCGCKAKTQTIENKEQKVPEMVEIEVDVKTNTSNNTLILENGKFTICKLYGTVKCNLCENCKTYKPSK